MSRRFWAVSCVVLVASCDPFPLKGAHPNDIPPKRPSVAAVQPDRGTPSGSTEVTIAGQDFESGAQLFFDDLPATDVQVVSATRITARTPAHASGDVDVTVVNPDEEQGSLPAGFTYAPNAAPEIASDLPAHATARVGETIVFRVDATDPDRDPTTLRLVHAPPGCAVVPGEAEEGAAELVVRWLVAASSGGAQHLVFDARDDKGNFNRTPITVLITGDAEHCGISFCDVTGDGIPDVVAGAPLAEGPGGADTGAIYVWDGSAAPTGAPTATLTVPGAAAGDRLGLASGQGIQCCDVTGDGIADVVAGASQADIGGVDRGAIYVWRGGSGLSGAVAPTATLTVPGASDNDQLGSARGQGIQCCDVTGDGTADIVAGADEADVGGSDRGAIHVWRGGAGLLGPVAPTATLAVPGASDDDRLGSASGQAIQCCDVTGDGLLDVVAGAREADIGGVVDAGAIFVWRGASTLSGAVAPTATLTVPGASDDDQLGSAPGQGIHCCDVTGDGIHDVVAGVPFVGATDAGAIHVWRGGAGLQGAAVPTASLAVPGAADDDQLGVASGQGIQCCDVTGDGILDIVAGAEEADVGGVFNTGAAYVWAGGSGLAGTVAQPTATLTVPGAAAQDQLGFVESGQGILCSDITGDGIADVVAGAQNADSGVVEDTGAIYVWSGGPGLSGTVVPTARLTVAAAKAQDQLGFASGQGIQCCDVTGDGVQDVVAGAQDADGEALANTGAIYVWEGGEALSGAVEPTSTLAVPEAVAADRLGLATGQGIQCCDVTGDGILDLVVGAQETDGAVVNAGAVHVWAGGALSDAPTATLAVPGATANQKLGAGSGQGVRCCDVTGDGIADIVAGVTVGMGAVHVWAGGPGLSGAGPTATVHGATAGDQLGTAAGQGIHCCDVTGDAVPDLVVGAQLADVAAVVNTGAVFLAPGGSTLVTLPPEVLAVPGAAAEDRLGGS